METLTWPQAKNRLITGVINIARYHPKYNYGNSFIWHKGHICRVWDYDGRVEVDMPGYPDALFVEVK